MATTSPLVGRTLMMGLLVANPGTTAAGVHPSGLDGFWLPTSATPPERPIEPEREVADEGQRMGSQVAELRRLSGLTSEQLAQLFGVSRRTIHFWISGKPLNEKHAERVTELLAIVKATDKGFASANRKALLMDHGGGRTAAALFAKGADDDGRILLGPPGPPRPERPRPSRELLEARRPPPPHELIAEPEPEGISRSGKLLGSWPIKTKRSK